MRSFVIDTNLVFSAILQPNGEIAQFFLAYRGMVLFAPLTMLTELEAHRDRLTELTGMSDEVLDRLTAQYLKHIQVIPDTAIPFESFIRALPLVRDVDLNDVVFVALAGHLNATLVTGDRKLRNGLMAKGYDRACSFVDLQQLLS